MPLLESSYIVFNLTHLFRQRTTTRVSRRQASNQLECQDATERQLRYWLGRQVPQVSHCRMFCHRAKDLRCTKIQMRATVEKIIISYFHTIKTAVQASTC